MLFWAGVAWQLLVLLASPVISLILGFDSRIWGAWFLSLLALVLWYKPFLGEALFVVAANVLTGIVGPLLWEHMKPYRQNRLRVFLDPTVDPARERLSRHSVAGRDRLRRMVRPRLSAMGRRNGSRFCRSSTPTSFSPWSARSWGSSASPSRWRSLRFFFCGSIRISERANDSFSSLVAFGLLGELVHARARERRHDAQRHADHRNSAAVLQLRRIVHARVLAGRRRARPHLQRRRGGKSGPFRV